ncbi:MAG: ROK family protein [Chloroflexi bacterium]|nr:ROK family protein [Chloroflexota bacterium]
MDQQDLAIAVDLGGTNLRVAVVDAAGVVLHRVRELTQAHLGPENAVERLVHILSSLARSAGADRLVGLGVSVASPVDPNTGIMYNPPSLPGWDGFSLKPVLEAAFHLPVCLANDATLAAVGEHAYGIGVGVANLVYMTISTGIGGGVLIDGHPVMGAGGFASEIGHMSIDRNGRPCKCGNVGCLETLASGTALASRVRERLAEGAVSVLGDLFGDDLRGLGAREVMRAASQRDPLAVEVVEQFARDLGLGIVNLLNVFDPQVVILGGGVCNSLHVFYPLLRAEVHQHAMSHMKGRIPLALSVLGDDAALLGAAYQVFQRERREGRG